MEWWLPVDGTGRNEKLLLSQDSILVWMMNNSGDVWLFWFHSSVNILNITEL